MSGVVEVVSPGLQTTMQDEGRWGYQSIGVAVAGPMDPFAHRLANALVSNARASATLEVTLTGPTLRFTDERRVAVAGAEFDLFLDDTPIPMHAASVARAGSTLRFGERRRGARAYVAVAGGFDVPPVLGSRATHVPTATGGWHGRAISRGDCLPLGASSGSRSVRGGAARLFESAVSDRRPHPVYGALAVRVLPGPQHDRFAPGALEQFVSAPYDVTVDSNRMGYRLAGPSLAHASAGADIISDATPLGAVQVPASGQPLLLMADRQTTGGYATIATVISADIGVAGQAAPGDRLQFRFCTRSDAIAALLTRERPLLAIEAEVQ